MAAAGHSVVEISPPSRRWQKYPVVWAAIGQMFHEAEASVRCFINRKQFDAFICHAPCGVAFGKGLTVFHLNTPQYIRANYSKRNPNYWKLRIVNQSSDRLSSYGKHRNIAVSHHQAEWLRGIGIRVDKVVYHPVNTRLFCPADNKEKAKNLIGLSPERITAISVGRFDKVKRFDRIIRLARRFPQIDFMLVGPRRSDFSYLPSNCYSYGPIEEGILPDYYRASDLFIQTPSSEAFSLVLAEALSCGLPFLSTRTGLAADLPSFNSLFDLALLDGDEKNDDAFLSRLVASSQLRIELASIGRKFAVEQLSSEVAGETYRNLIQNCLSG
ncbi:MAG: glycosyltransferase family 4 protein [Deltaproteobacteria bacterium]|nr:glycosyltransferase family 4 protein [Deltaproteobacteria bacterium]